MTYNDWKIQEITHGMDQVYEIVDDGIQFLKLLGYNFEYDIVISQAKVEIDILDFSDIEYRCFAAKNVRFILDNLKDGSFVGNAYTFLKSRIENLWLYKLENYMETSHLFEHLINDLEYITMCEVNEHLSKQNFERIYKQ